MDRELFKVDDSCEDHSTAEQGMEKTQQSLESTEKPDVKQSKSMQDMGSRSDAEELVDVESQPTHKQGDSNEVLEKIPDTVAETPREEENTKQKGQKKKPKNPFMPQIAAKNKTTQKKIGNQNGGSGSGSGSDLAEVLKCPSSSFHQNNTCETENKTQPGKE